MATAAFDPLTKARLDKLVENLEEQLRPLE